MTHDDTLDAELAAADARFRKPCPCSVYSDADGINHWYDLGGCKPCWFDLLQSGKAHNKRTCDECGGDNGKPIGYIPHAPLELCLSVLPHPIMILPESKNVYDIRAGIDYHHDGSEASIARAVKQATIAALKGGAE